MIPDPVGSSTSPKDHTVGVTVVTFAYFDHDTDVVEILLRIYDELTEF